MNVLIKFGKTHTPAILLENYEKSIYEEKEFSKSFNLGGKHGLVARVFVLTR